MDNNRIITNLKALLDGYLTSTGECVKNNIIINDTEIVRTLVSVIEKLNNNVDESTNAQLKNTISRNEIIEIGINHYKNKINALGLRKKVNSQILNARIKFKRAYEYWSKEEDDILKALISMNLSLKQIGEILQRGKGSIESRIAKHKIESIPKNQFFIEDDNIIKGVEVQEDIKVEKVVQEFIDGDTKEEVFKEDVEETLIEGACNNQINEVESIKLDMLSNIVTSCIYCNQPFPAERKKLGYSYCVKCSSEKSKTFVEKGFQTREGHKIMRNRYPM